MFQLHRATFRSISGPPSFHSKTSGHTGRKGALDVSSPGEDPAVGFIAGSANLINARGQCCIPTLKKLEKSTFIGRSGKRKFKNL
jgi:hypothetical protein